MFKIKRKIILLLAIASSCLWLNPSFGEEPAEGYLPHYNALGPGVTNLALDASPFTGESFTSFPIELLPAAGDIQEKLRLCLNYRSGAGNSWLGRGWDLELGYIAKICKFGADSPNNPYLLVLNGQSQELVSMGNGQYRTKTESHIRIQLEGSIWRVWEKDGTEYRFEIFRAGKWVLTRITDTHGISIAIDYYKPNNEEIYLTEIRYPEGPGLTPYCKVSFISEYRDNNYISYYFGSPLRMKRHLREIHILADDQVQKKYYLDYTSYEPNCIFLLRSITECGKDGTSLPPVNFTYATAQEEDFFDRDQTWLPDTGNLFTQQNGYEFQDLGGERFPQNFDIAVLDLTADGIPDFLGCKYEQSFFRGSYSEPPIYAFKTTWLLYRGTKNGFSNQPEVWLNPEDSYFRDHLGREESISLGYNATLADMNGDGLPDLVYSKYGGIVDWNLISYTIYHIKVRLNTGNGFGAETTWLPAGQAYYRYQMCGFGFLFRLRVGQTAHFADMNGDGKADLIYYRYGGPVAWAGATRAVFGWNVRFSTGSGFASEEHTWLTYDKGYLKYGWDNPPGTIGAQQYQVLEHVRLGSNAALADMNNDGLVDLVYNDFADKWAYDMLPCSNYPEYQPLYNWKVRYNTGIAFSDNEVMFYPNAPAFRYTTSIHTCGRSYNAVSARIGENGILADVNNDNLRIWSLVLTKTGRR